MTLDGVRVVEMATLLPGPYAGRRLAGMGADVVKVEPPGGDPAKALLPDAYEELNAPKTVVELDLKTEADRDRLHDRVAAADAFLTSNRPSTLERLAADADTLQTVHADLVFVHLLGHRDGERVGHDLTYQAEAGLVGEELPSVPLADLAAAERVVQTVLVGLRSPGSRHRVVAEAVAAAWGRAAGPVQALLEEAPAYDVFRCADERLLAVACLEPAYRDALADLLGLSGDAVTREAIADRLAGKDRAAWLGRLRDAGLPVAAVPGRDEAPEDGV